MQARWAENQNARNTELCFACKLQAYEHAQLVFIAKDVYNLYINGQFIQYGPARAAKGFAREERVDLSGYLTQEENVISVYVQSNYTKTLCFALEKPLFAAEIRVNGQTILTTDDFRCFEMTDKVKRVERMSFQRGYVEVYRMSKAREPFDFDAFPECKLILVELPKLLPRNVAMSKHGLAVAKLTEQGGVTIDLDRTWENDFTRQLDTGNNLFSYTRAECDAVVSKEILSFVCDETSKERDFRYGTYAFDRTYCGKFQIKISVKAQTEIWLGYDDILIDGKLKFNREQIIHALKWELQPGEYILHSGEVYTAKYVTLYVLGEATVKGVSMIRVENPNADRMQLTCADETLSLIVEASRHSFQHNGYDLLTDCPSRERAGYLCDGFFAARAEAFFCGENLVEENLLENYALYDHADFSHPGILPMCYPAMPYGEDDFIPNWILWYVLQLEDYVARTGNNAFIDQHKAQILDVLDYFQGKENELGLLEDLDGWVFVEWSRANDFVNGVNFPSNMCYYGALRAAAKLLGDDTLLEKAERLKKTIIDLSYNGEFFIDNALREEGKKDGNLQVTENISETCQNYAAFFEIFSKEENPDFYNRLINELGVLHREQYHGGVYESNMFIGYILRLSVLLREREYKAVLAECKARFADMANDTGTIWELFQTNASCNHGFGSVVGQMVAYSLCGVVGVDETKRILYITETSLETDCSVTLPLRGGRAEIRVQAGNREISLHGDYTLATVC